MDISLSNVTTLLIAIKDGIVISSYYNNGNADKEWVSTISKPSYR